MTMKKIVYLLILLVSLIPFSDALSNDTDLYILTQIMQQVPPDALILLDLSGSMDWVPWNDALYYDPGTCTPTCDQWVTQCTNKCKDDIPYYRASASPYTSSCWNSGAKYIDSTKSCSGYAGPYYKYSGSGHTKECKGGSAPPSTLYYDPGTCTQVCTNYSTLCNNQCGDNIPYYTTNDSPHTVSCSNSSNDAKWGDSTCLGPFYQNSGTGHTTDCSTSKLVLAKRAVFNFLDIDNDGVDPAVADGTINHFDLDYLKIRMGYMRYYGCSSSSAEATGYPQTSTSSYTSGCNTLIYPFTDSSSPPVPTPYSRIYCKNDTSCTSSSSGTATSVAKESASGGTPLAAALQEAKYYLNYTKANDNYADCRQKFVILITDGDDTYACGNNGNEGQIIQYKGRRETVAQARALANAGYYVFVVGFGASMPTYLQNTLNWAAYYGKTKNTGATQSITQMYTIPYGGIYPDGVTQCMDSAYTDGGLVGGYEYYYANTNDPGQYGISGYAFIAQNASQLDDAIMSIRDFIISLSAQSTSYVAPVVPISQYQSTSSEDLMYLGMFKPTATTMWKGNIKKFGIATTNSGTIKIGDVIDANGALAMDASTHTIKGTARSYWSTSADGGEVEAGGVGEVLQARDPDSRSIYTYSRINTDLTHSSNAFTKANTTYITTTSLGVSTAAERDEVIDFIHGWDAWDWDSDGITNEKRDWILGGIIHSRPVVIHYASKGYDVIYAGGNDGMLHAFRDDKGTTADDGKELWGFIPPDLLGNLKNFNSSLASLQIFVDGSPKAWTGTNPITGQPQTILIFGERRGGNHYYALDVTDPEVPLFLWSISPTEIVTGTTKTPSTDYQQLGQTWSTPKFGKIKNGTDTKVVAFIGGGYDAEYEDTTPAGTDTSGKAVYIVDIANGNKIWGYSSMTYSVPSDITPIDSLLPTGTNGDNLIDRLYVGNVGGEIWRFDLCTSTTGPCVPDMSNTGNWTGKRIFTGSGKIFYPPDVTFENQRDSTCNSTVFSGTYNMLFFGTGDREKPGNTSSGNRLYAVKDYDILPNPFTTLTESCLTDVTAYGTPLSTLQSSMGWYIRLNKSAGTNPNPGEKCSGQAVALGGAVYYTTFTPTPDTTYCEVATGSGNIYILQYQTGNAFFDLDSDLVNEAGDRSIEVVAGVPSGIIVAIINGDTVKTYGGVPAGVISPKSSVTNAIIPIDWRILF